MMQLRFTETDDFIVLNKPSDIRTHKVSEAQFGFVEFLSEKLLKSLYVVHRLDKGTSGLILFAKTKEAAASLSALFEKQEMKKTYYFLTDKKIEAETLTVTSHIDKQNNNFFNVPNRPDNSETEFKLIKSLGPYFLWAAYPKTGKAHQIRLHAEKARMPILGDTEHGGTKFFRLALHSSHIQFELKGKAHAYEAELPPLFTEAYHSEMLALLQENYAKRHQLYKIDDHESYRLLHLECEWLQADIYSDHLWVYDYSKDGLKPEEKADLLRFCEDKKLTPVIRHMLDRGKGVGGLEFKTLDSHTEAHWICAEEKVHYKLKTDSGFSPGLFLDQRENRKWVRENSDGKSVLNLFCYTAGFSVCAALGKAKEVTSVDVSERFLMWSQENFTLNRLDPAQYEFFEQDAIVFLKGSIKRGRKWDFIICDPPSFARTKDSIWKLEQDLPQLAKLMLDCLEDGGRILFTCNLEKRTREEIMEIFCENLRNKKYAINRMPMLSLDYELTDDLTNLMKGFFLTKA